MQTYRIVLTDSRNSAKSGKYLEVLGSYDPTRKVNQFDATRIKELIGTGAQLSATMNNFLIENKVIVGKKRDVLSVRNPKSKSKKEGDEKKAEAGAVAPVAEVAPTPAPTA